MNLLRQGPRARFLALAAAALAALPAFGQQPPAPGDAAPQTPPAADTAAQPAPAAPRITDIIVLGNKVLNREAIVSGSGLKVGEPATQAALDDARRRLEATGNYGTHRDPGVIVRADVVGDTAKVVIDVDENDLVSGIQITGSGPIKPAEILPLLQTKVGQVLNMNTLYTDATRIAALYKQRGFVAQVGSDVGIKDGILNIPIEVARVGKLKITGLKKTREWVVTREMKLKPGTYFNSEDLQRDYTRIMNTDLFETVDPALLNPQPGVVDITLSVTEKRTGTVAVGAGYSNRQKLVGRAEIGESNFLGRGQQINLLWETGGLAHRNSFELGFTEPWLDRRHTSLSVSLYDKTVYRFAQSISSVTGGETIGSSTDYYEAHTGGQFMLSRPFGEAFRGFAGFRYDNVRVPALQLNAQDAAVLQNGPLATVNLRFTHNTRDFDLEPASGGYEILTTDLGRADLRPVTSSTGEAATGVFGQVNWTKYGIDARRYLSPQGRRLKPRDRRNVFALRMMFGASSGTLPFSEQYFVGGAETLRGYSEDRFWGNNMFLGSAEFRTPLAQSLTGVVFADAGDAWGGPYEGVTFSGFKQHSGFSPSLGFGVGLRVQTPIGPIRIDQGFGREGAHTHFSIGHVF